MNGLDLLLLIIVGASVVGGFVGGFARVGIAFLAMLAGIFCGFWFYGIPAGWLMEYLGSKTAANLLGFFFVVGGFLCAGAVAGWLLSKMFKWSGLSSLDRLLGAAFGLVRGTVMAVALVAVIMAFAPSPPPGWIVTSRGLPYVLGASSICAALAPAPLKDAFHESVRQLRKIWDEHMKKTRKLEEVKS